MHPVTRLPSRITDLAIIDVRLDGATQSRAGLNDEQIASYAEKVTAGVEFPPLVVFYDGESYWLADGFHRVHGYVHAGRQRIPCDVRQGTQRDAILFGVGANDDHGLPRTRADKRRAVGLLLSDEEWSGKSDRWIAQACKVNHELVGSMRAETTGGSASSGPAVRLGRDGKTRRPPRRREPEEQQHPMTDAHDTEPAPPPNLRVVSGEIQPREPRNQTRRELQTIEFDERIRPLLNDGLAVYEIAKQLGLPQHKVQSAKRRLLAGAERKNPLESLANFAVEFSDTWEDALSNTEHLWPQATEAELLDLIEKLENLIISTKNLLRPLRKNAAEKGRANEQKPVRETPTNAD